MIAGFPEPLARPQVHALCEWARLEMTGDENLDPVVHAPRDCDTCLRPDCAVAIDQDHATAGADPRGCRYRPDDLAHHHAPGVAGLDTHRRARSKGIYIDWGTRTPDVHICRKNSWLRNHNQVPQSRSPSHNPSRCHRRIHRDQSSDIPLAVGRSNSRPGHLDIGSRSRNLRARRWRALAAIICEAWCDPLWRLRAVHMQHHLVPLNPCLILPVSVNSILNHSVTNCCASMRG